jgi:putative ABC transport system substrate-binding protein
VGFRLSPIQWEPISAGLDFCGEPGRPPGANDEANFHRQEQEDDDHHQYGRDAQSFFGFLNGASRESYAPYVTAFHNGLKESGYVEGQNVTIEYRWAEGRNDRLPVMATDLVQRRVSVIAAADGTAAALAAKAATPTIPIVFMVGADPVELGLVASLDRPGGNMTGVGALAVGTVAKRLQLLHELVPAAAEIAFLRNPTNPYFGALETRELQAAAAVLGVRLLLLNASNPHEIEVAFANLLTQRAGGFLLGTDPFFITARDQLVALANRHAVPAIYPFREDAAAGGLVSYGASNRDAFRLVGGYTGSILSGNKPADLPVQQVTKIEMTVNLRTAKALGLSIRLPLTLSGPQPKLTEIMVFLDCQRAIDSDPGDRHRRGRPR